ncbi:MAG: 2Fe-2S iron-sulfur cluster binding domain-containing protein [Lentisphaerae bacterium]|nr:2Fe-2S iron-sulfur cluster binding domain-containing protein [Lentisphaerota bacterium]
MSDNYEISINHGAKTISAQSGESLFQALTRNRVFIPTACGGRGICGLCRLKITEGAQQPNDTEKKHLKDHELQDGMRLACQSLVKNNLAIEIPEAYYQASQYRVKISKITQLTHDILLLRCQAVEPKFIHVEAGAWMLFHAPPSDICPDGVKRSFSIASDTRNKQALEFIIRRTPKGLCTKWIFEQMQVGDEVTLEGPHGDFRLHDTPKDAIFIAGGSGLSAIRSILLEIKSQKIPKRATLFFGAVSRRDLYLLDELQTLEKDIPGFTFIPALSAPAADDNWQGETGLITDVVAKHLQDAQNKEAYLCGSPGMLDACIKVLSSKGMPESAIFFDKFV